MLAGGFGQAEDAPVCDAADDAAGGQDLVACCFCDSIRGEDGLVGGFVGGVGRFGGELCEGRRECKGVVCWLWWLSWARWMHVWLTLALRPSCLDGPVKEKSQHMDCAAARGTWTHDSYEFVQHDWLLNLMSLSNRSIPKQQTACSRRLSQKAPSTQVSLISDKRRPVQLGTCRLGPWEARSRILTAWHYVASSYRLDTAC